MIPAFFGHFLMLIGFVLILGSLWFRWQRDTSPGRNHIDSAMYPEHYIYQEDGRPLMKRGTEVD